MDHPNPGTDAPPRIGATAGRRDRGDVPAAAVWLPIALLAFAARLLPTLHGGGLGGIDDYDEGVYFAGAQALRRAGSPTGTSSSCTRPASSFCSSLSPRWPAW